jgi:hypothetical protein
MASEPNQRPPGYIPSSHVTRTAAQPMPRPVAPPTGAQAVAREHRGDKTQGICPFQNGPFGQPKLGLFAQHCPAMVRPRVSGFRPAPAVWGCVCRCGCRGGSGVGVWRGVGAHGGGFPRGRAGEVGAGLWRPHARHFGRFSDAVRLDV